MSRKLDEPKMPKKTPKSEQNEQSDLKADAFIEGKNRQSSSQIYFLLEVKTITKIARKWDC